MDRSQLTSLKRPQLQRLARRESFKANLKNIEIIRLLLEKYPDGVPELTERSPASKRSSSSKTKQPTRRSKRKSTAKSGPVSVKTEETHPSVHIEPLLDEPEVQHKGRDVRSMAPPPITPTAALQSPTNRRLPTTPRIDVVVDGHDAGHPPEATPTPPGAVAATSHQAHEMLRNLTDIIDSTSLNPEEPSSILYRAKALSTILDTTILPRIMKVDKEVKDFVWMRAAVETELGPQFKKEGVLPDHRRSGIFNIRSDLSFPAARPPSPKRPRGDGGAVPPPPELRASKRTRVQ